MVGASLDELEQAVREAAVAIHADRRVRSPATDSATPPEVRFIFDLDADNEDQATARAAAVVRDAVTGGLLAEAQWQHHVRIVG